MASMTSNVIILISDEHNPFFSSVFGHPTVKTPNMERLARAGTLYKNAYCPSPLCAPSRSAFFAGRRVHEVQVYSNCNVNLNKEFPSYGEVLSNQGIYAAYIGKTDVYADGEELGFSEMINAHDRKLPGDTNFGRKPLTIRQEASKRASQFGPRENAFKGDVQNIDEAIEWLNIKTASLKQPWILTINVISPHFPQYTDEELWNLYAGDGDLPKYGRECESANHPYAKDLRDHFEADKFTEEQIRGLRRGYLADITFVDRQLGRLMDEMEDLGINKNTNLIYTSDHGDMMGKFGMWWKCSLYEDSVRIPCIAAGPDFQRGLVVETPVDLLDIQAALFKATGAERPEGWSGIPLQDIKVNDPDRVVFSEYHGHGTRSGAYMIRKGDWKLIYFMEAPHQLFNLAADPEELRNVYGQYSDKARELESELRKICVPEEENEKAHRFQEEQLKIIKEKYPDGEGME